MIGRCTTKQSRMLSTGIDVSKLVISRATSRKSPLSKDKLVFGQTFTDHMLEVDWNSGTGWQVPKISPYHGLTLDPACSALHYALQAFEGMKAYLDNDDNIRLFRPMMNMDRLEDSCLRLSFPTFDKVQYLECIKRLISVDRAWIPKGQGYSLYLRPTVISTHPFLGVGPAKAMKHFTIMSPAGPYYKEGFAAVKLYADDKFVRAWPGGSGNSKLGAYVIHSSTCTKISLETMPPQSCPRWRQLLKGTLRFYGSLAKRSL